VKDVVVLGGPNGAGKTTAAAKLLPADLNIREFVNADEIARGISPFNPEASALLAGRLMIERMQELARAGESFAFETTCAGHSHLRFLTMCRELGYRLTLVFLWLSSGEAAVERVARRVAHGGHSIPRDVILRRYDAGIRSMLRSYLPLVHIAAIYDNSDGAGHLVAERHLDGRLLIHDPVCWATIKRTAA
jgi:predicted ABC-type ATPase